MRHDRTDYHQNTKKRPRTLDPTECKHAICHLNGTNNPELDAFNYSDSFTFINDIQKRRLLETKQPHFRITKLNTFHFDAFAWIANSQLVLNSTLRERLSVGTAVNIILKIKIAGLSLLKKSKSLIMIKIINSFIMDTLYLVFMVMVFANQIF